MLDTVAHLTRRFIGKGYCHNAPGRRSLYSGEPGDSVHKHSGFARTGAGQHQGTARRSGNRITLSLIQPF
jgi:hypothetical protein